MREDDAAAGAEFPEFGFREQGATYRLRPGGYVVLRRDTGEIATVATDEGLFLPGGGIEAGESPEAAAVREAYEECGFRVVILAGLGIADEFVHARIEGIHYRKRCSYFSARLERQDGRPEEGHEPGWFFAADCLAHLTLMSDRWAVGRLAAQAPRGSRTRPGTE